MINNETKRYEIKASSAMRSIFLPWLKSNVYVFAVLIFAVLCLYIGFSKNPQLYQVDYGQYQWILPDVGLNWTEEDLIKGNLQFANPVTTFDYVHFSWSNLFTPNAGNSLVYQVAIVRLFTEPFGLRFNINALALVSAVLLLISVVFMTLGMRRLLPRCWFVPIIILCMVFLNGNFCSMFRGLYPEGSAVIYSLLFIAGMMYVWSLPKAKRVGKTPIVIILSFLMLKASTPLIVFLPLVVILDFMLIFSSLCKTRFSTLLAAINCIIFIAGFTSSVQLAVSDPDYFSNASIYESVFNTMLPAYEKPNLLMSEFGLDESYLADIGKSFYMDENIYTHNPRNPEEAEKLFSRITAQNTVLLYILHPVLLGKIIKNIPIYYERFFENSRYREIDYDANRIPLTRTDSGLAFALFQLLPHSYHLFFVTQMILFVSGVIAAFLRRNLKILLVSLYSICCVVYLPFCVILNGYNLAPNYILYQQFLEIFLVSLLLIFFLSVVPYIEQWISVYMEDPYQLSQSQTVPVSDKGFFSWLRKKVFDRLFILIGSRTFCAIATAALGCAMLILVYLPDTHPVSINNGDFGRVMAQMDVTWPGSIYFDTRSQSGHEGIEEFEFTAPFDFLKLTPFRPTFTLYWFVSAVRLLTEPFGKPFSTWLLSWIMGVISLLCTVKIVYDVYPLLKRWSILVGFLLCVFLYSETTLAWYNGFYGEGTILLGILLSLMCSIHLCLMPRSKKGCIFWLLGLAWSLFIMVGAKSQMIVTIPCAVVLFAVLAIYHKPYRYDLMAVYALIMFGMCGLIAFSGLGVYQSERAGDSVSSKSNMWHAYFYGIFMISDDPIGDMEELGVDTAMAPDIGKYVSFEDDSWYVYAPLSPEADKAFHQHVSMMTIIKWYLSHPQKLWYMLNYAAKITQKLYTDFRVYKGQNYADPKHDPVDGMNFWPGWRAFWTPSLFIGYVILYGVALYLCIRFLFRKNVSNETKILCCIPLFLILTAAIQFPISVMGNGFGDNQKQMFGFELCHDLIMIGILVLGARYLYNYRGKIHTPEIKNKLFDMRLPFFGKRSHAEGEKELQLNWEESDPNEKTVTVNADDNSREKESASGENA